MKKKTALILVALLATVTVACVSTVIAVLVGRNDPPPTNIAPDYAPKDEEPNAETIPHDTGDKMEQPEGGGAVSLIYTSAATVDLSERKVSLLFGNPQKSNQDVVVQILVKDHIILQSGRLTPGHRVTTLDLPEDTPLLGAGTYTEENCKFVVLYYDPVTGEKAILRTEIPITVTVKE
jgi:hypothetical protein